MNKKIISLIQKYRKWLSPDTGIFRFALNRRTPTCVFFPTCSVYTIEAIEKYGIFKGVYLGVRRIIRCHPWQKNHYDPVP